VIVCHASKGGCEVGQIRYERHCRYYGLKPLFGVQAKPNLAFLHDLAQLLRNNEAEIKRPMPVSV
jgi:hypothetical protein